MSPSRSTQSGRDFLIGDTVGQFPEDLEFPRRQAVPGSPGLAPRRRVGKSIQQRQEGLGLGGSPARAEGLQGSHKIGDGDVFEDAGGSARRDGEPDGCRMQGVGHDDNLDLGYALPDCPRTLEAAGHPHVQQDRFRAKHLGEADHFLNRCGLADHPQTVETRQERPHTLADQRPVPRKEQMDVLHCSGETSARPGVRGNQKSAPASRRGS